MKQHRQCSLVYWFPQSFIEFAMINITERMESLVWSRVYKCGYILRETDFTLQLKEIHNIVHL